MLYARNNNNYSIRVTTYQEILKSNTIHVIFLGECYKSSSIRFSFLENLVEWSTLNDDNNNRYYSFYHNNLFVRIIVIAVIAFMDIQRLLK